MLRHTQPEEKPLEKALPHRRDEAGGVIILSRQRGGILRSPGKGHRDIGAVERLIEQRPVKDR